MFLKDLTDIQQKLFLGIARELIEADNKITEQEHQLITALSEEMGQQELIANPTDDMLKQYFPNRPAQISIILELIGLSACDGEYSPEEDKVIQRLKNVFGLSDKDLEACHAWVRKLYSVYGEATDLMKGPA